MLNPECFSGSRPLNKPTPLSELISLVLRQDIVDPISAAGGIMMSQ